MTIAFDTTLAGREAPASIPSRLVAGLRRAAHVIAEEFRIRRDMRILTALSDRELADIGLARGDIRRVLRAPEMQRSRDLL